MVEIESYLNRHRWVTDVFKVDETADQVRYYVATFLEDSRPNPFADKRIEVEEIRIEWHNCNEEHPNLEPRGWLLRKIIGPKDELPHLYYLVKVDKQP